MPVPQQTFRFVRASNPQGQLVNDRILWQRDEADVPNTHAPTHSVRWGPVNVYEISSSDSDIVRDNNHSRMREIIWNNVFVRMLRTVWTFLVHLIECNTGPATTHQDSTESAAELGESITICRICWRGEQMDRLIYPCRCRDIARLVHRRCLLNRLQNTNERQCRICLTDFTAGRMEKQELLKLKCKQIIKHPCTWIILFLVIIYGGLIWQVLYLKDPKKPYEKAPTLSSI